MPEPSVDVSRTSVIRDRDSSPSFGIAAAVAALRSAALGQHQLTDTNHQVLRRPGERFLKEVDDYRAGQKAAGQAVDG
jgi:hypothetical protein